MEALRTHVVDDVHLSHAIARLLELLTTSIRTRFLRFAPMDRGNDVEHDRASAPTSRPQSPRARENRRDGTSNGWTPGQNTTQNLSYVDSNGHSTGTPMTSVHDPLAGIPAQPINSSNINVSFMPPPPSVYHNYYDPNATPPAGDLDGSNVPSQSMQDSGALPDWFALPLDQFFNSSTPPTIRPMNIAPPVNVTDNPTSQLECVMVWICTGTATPSRPRDKMEIKRAIKTARYAGCVLSRLRLSSQDF